MQGICKAFAFDDDQRFYKRCRRRRTPEAQPFRKQLMQPGDASPHQTLKTNKHLGFLYLPFSTSSGHVAHRLKVYPNSRRLNDETCTCTCFHAFVYVGQLRPTDTKQSARQDGESDRPHLHPARRDRPQLGSLGIAGSVRIGWPAGTQARDHDNHDHWHWLHARRPYLRGTTAARRVGVDR